MKKKLYGVCAILCLMSNVMLPIIIENRTDRKKIIVGVVASSTTAHIVLEVNQYTTPKDAVDLGSIKVDRIYATYDIGSQRLQDYFPGINPEALQKRFKESGFALEYLTTGAELELIHEVPAVITIVDEKGKPKIVVPTQKELDVMYRRQQIKPHVKEATPLPDPLVRIVTEYVH